MSILQEVKKYKNSPVAIIFKGASILGVELAKLLIDQGAFVICIDEYNKKKKKKVEHLLLQNHFAFVDISGTNSLSDSIDRVDYIFYFNLDNESFDTEVTTTKFLERSNTLDRLLQLGANKDSKFLLASSIEIHRVLQARKEVSSLYYDEDEAMSYTILEVQRYAENLTWEYHKRGGLDARIVRIGELLGEGIDIDRDSLITKYIKDAISAKVITIEGDGLENLYFVHVLDAAYGLLKAQFSQNTSGKVLSLFIPKDITVLNLVYKILDFEPKAAGIQFIDKDVSVELSIYKPAPNVREIGWKPKISFERALAQTINYFYACLGKKKDKVERQYKSKKDEKKKKKSLKDFFINFFFEVKEEPEKKSVLDSMLFRSSDKNAVHSIEPDKIIRFERSTKKTDKKKEKKPSKISFSFLSLWNKIKSLTVKSFLLYLLLGICFLSVYIFLVVPVVRSSYFIVKAYQSIEDTRFSIEHSQYEKIEGNLNKTNSYLANVQNNLQKLTVLEKFPLFVYINDLQKTIEESQRIILASKQIYTQYEQVGEYLNNYSSNLHLVGSEGVGISDMNSTYNLRDYDKSYVLQAKELLSKDFYIDNQVTKITWIDLYIQKYQENLDYIRNHALHSEEILNYIYPVLFNKGGSTYAALLQDESEMNSQGGKISSIAVFTIKDGYITQIQLLDPDSIDIHLDKEQTQLIRNDMKFLFPEDGLLFSTLDSIYDEKLFETLIKNSLSDIYGSKIDTILLLNRESIKDFIVLLDGITLHGDRKITATNIDNELDSGRVTYKELLASILVELFSDLPQFFVNVPQTFQDQIETKKMRILTSNTSLRLMMEQDKVLTDFPKIYDSMDMRFISENPISYQVTLKSDIQIKNDNALSKHLFTFKRLGTSNAESIVIIGFSPSVLIKDVKLNGKGIELASSYANRIFLYMSLETNETGSILISTKSTSIEIDKNKDYNYTIALQKPFGIEYSYTVTIGGNKLIPHYYPAEGVEQDVMVVNTGEVNKDILLHYSFSQENK